MTTGGSGSERVTERLRVVVAGPDAPEDPRAVALARALRDAGAEVVLTGVPRSAGQLAATVVQEDADAVGLAGAAPGLLADLLGRLSGAGVDDVTAFVLGGPEDGDLPAGVRRFPDGTPPGDVVAALHRAGGTGAAAPGRHPGEGAGERAL
ncbi:methylmalonyl-CoA mutase C-terminal domain/subunit [Geodermatophilus bullaregiensis]|uniref:cobalamin B12-binding domain-containing protein n=1 Tax=Geodermatophilus bullaregiensis TaxID=1564160 RepID=UPI00195CBD43|nr:methylmalonyl-CoA mutase [Geodermatophilus bullaregiensis]MBM7805894.1 methylmalonyl-CoA mutase C-terminal domain/subunit [Geodermatophilus bullaregiensis]